MGKPKRQLVAFITAIVAWAARRLDYIIIKEARQQAAILRMEHLISYTHHSGYLNQDHKARRIVQRNAGQALHHLRKSA